MADFGCTRLKLISGSIERYKARLGAKGFAKEYDIDYNKNFVLVTNMTTICTLIFMAASQHWILSQLDLKNAFLNGELVEEVYMHPP